MICKLLRLLVAVFLLSNCASDTRNTAPPFDLLSAVRDDIRIISDEAASNKIPLSTFFEKIREEFGTIYHLGRYTTSSTFSTEQEGFANIVYASGLKENETFVAISLDADQHCYVICNENDIVVRSAMD
jgi:hypothetical protein